MALRSNNAVEADFKRKAISVGADREPSAYARLSPLIFVSPHRSRVSDHIDARAVNRGIPTAGFVVSMMRRATARQSNAKPLPPHTALVRAVEMIASQVRQRTSISCRSTALAQSTTTLPSRATRTRRRAALLGGSDTDPGPYNVSSAVRRGSPLLSCRLPHSAVCGVSICAIHCRRFLAIGGRSHRSKQMFVAAGRLSAAIVLSRCSFFDRALGVRCRR